MFLEAAGRGLGVDDWVFGQHEAVCCPLIVETKGNLDSQKGRRVNHDPYGGDAVIWDDSDFFAGTSNDALSNADQCDESVDESLPDEFLNTQSAAVQRLAQLRRHLAEVSMQANQDHDLRMAEMFHCGQQQPQWSWRQDAIDFTNEQSDANYSSDQHHLHFSPTIAHPLAGREVAEFETPKSFHCPHIDCRFNLELQNQSLPVADEPTACIHTDCLHCSDTLEDWLAHVLSVHHDAHDVLTLDQDDRTWDAMNAL